MKHILVIDAELKQLESDRVLIKRNKTIIKDRRYFNDTFLKGLAHPYKFLIEEWEICSPEKIQIVSSNNGEKLHPVHVVSDIKPNNGAKALFQSEKMIVLKISNNLFELGKYSISENGIMMNNIIKIGKFKHLMDIDIPVDFLPILKTLYVDVESRINNYTEPLWSE